MEWSKLSMADRAKYMALGVSNGITKLSDIHNTYNSYAEGGDKETIINRTPVTSSTQEPVELVVTPERSYYSTISSDVDTQQSQLDKADAREMEVAKADKRVHKQFDTESWRNFLLTQAAGAVAAGTLGAGLSAYTGALGTTIATGTPTTAATLTGELAGGLATSEIANLGYRTVTGSPNSYMQDFSNLIGINRIGNEYLRSGAELGINLLDPAFYVGPKAIELGINAGKRAIEKGSEYAMNTVADPIMSRLEYRYRNNRFNEDNYIRVVEGIGAIEDAMESGVVRTNTGWYKGSLNSTREKYGRYLSDYTDDQLRKMDPENASSIIEDLRFLRTLETKMEEIPKGELMADRDFVSRYLTYASHIIVYNRAKITSLDNVPDSEATKFMQSNSKLVGAKEESLIKDKLLSRFEAYFSSSAYKDKARFMMENGPFKANNDNIESFVEDVKYEFQNNLKDISFRVFRGPKDYTALYNKFDNTVYINADVLNSSSSPDDILSALVHEIGHSQYNNKGFPMRDVVSYNDELLSGAIDNLTEVAKKRLLEEDIKYITDPDELRQHLLQVLDEAVSNNWKSTTEILNKSKILKSYGLAKIFKKDFLERVLGTSGILSVSTPVFLEDK